MTSLRSRPRPAADRRTTILAAAAALVATAVGMAAAHEPFTATAARHVLAAAAAKPSVHTDRPDAEAALVAAGLPADAIARLWRAVDGTVLPGLGNRLDGFLFLTRDPAWRSWRGHFAEYLDIPAAEIDPAAMAEMRAYGGVITLSGLGRLPPSLLAALDGFGGEDWGTALEFPEIRALTAAEAAGLARTQCLLVLPALESLSAEAARALAAHEGVGVVLGGIRRLAPDTAAALADLRSLRGMLLPDLEALDSPALAARLARQDHVFLPRLTTLSPDVARALAPNEGGDLALPCLDPLPEDVAKILGGSGYFRIALAGSLAPRPAAALVGHNGPLILVGSRPPSPATVAALAAHPGEIGLPGLTALPVELARALQNHEGMLACAQLADLPADTAAALAPRRGGLWLGGLQTIRPEAARSLATCTGPVALPDLRAITPRALAALREKQDLELPPRETLTILPEQDGSRDDFADP